MRPFRPLILLAASAFFVCAAAAQVDSTQSKLDTLVAGQKQIITMQDKIYAEVYSEPLTGKTWGIEFNPAFFLLEGSDNATGIATGIMLFAVNRKAEIAFPIYYYDKSGTDALTHFNVDAMYRQFLGKHQDGFYFSAGLRYTYLHGNTGYSYLFGYPSNSTATQSKFGVHFGIGYRYYSESGLFWGTSFYAGRYFSDQEDDFSRVVSDDTKRIIDFELLKFGYAF